MTNFFNKIKKHGFRRVCVYMFLLLLQKTRYLVYRFLLSDNNAKLKGVKFNQPAQFIGKGKIVLDGVNIGVWPSPKFLTTYAYFEARSDSATINIGEGTFLNNSAIIIADRTSIKIGKRCLIGLDFSAVDSDFHGLSIENRSNGQYECADVFIGDDVFIGNNVNVLKGVVIGNGAVIGSGSLVVTDVPAMTVFAGVPAKYIKPVQP